MKQTIALQTPGRSELDQSSLFSYDQLTAARPTAPVIHRDARFLLVRSGSGILRLQGREYPLAPGTLAAILPWQISEITRVDEPVTYSLMAYHFDTVARAAHLFRGEDGQPMPMARLMETVPVLELSPRQRAEAGHIADGLARELGMDEIREIRRRVDPALEIETFCHGAMCVSYSGRCLLSNYMTGRDSNRGQCAQPCRWKYYLSEETRPGQLYEIGENENGSYILNANDLCTAPFLDLICNAGVDSLKIEGRAKTFYYVASVTAAYRKALDAYLADPANDNFELPAEVYEELTRTSHRHYSPGFYFGREQARQATDSATYIREWEFVGTVDGWENGVASCQQRGKWSLGDTLEALCPDGRSIPLNPEWIENEAGERVESTPHAMEKYTIPTPELPPMSLLRRKTV